MFKVRVVENITKEYPDMIKVLIYKQPRYYLRNDGAVKRSRDEIDHEKYVPSVSSINRTKTLVKDIVLCNDFELFCTFTFDSKKVDRYDFHGCWRKMSTWLHHQSDNSRERGIDFKYLIIPEQHKDGAWHFHALISGYSGSLHDSGMLSASGRPIYNITTFRSGFTTSVEIDCKEAVSNYVTKYITKAFINTFNQRRFFCSRNLIRPTRILNSRIFSLTPPLFRVKTMDHPQTEEYVLPILNEYPTKQKKHQNYFDMVKQQKLLEMKQKQDREIYF